MAVKPSWSERVRIVVTTAVPESETPRPKPGVGGLSADGLTANMNDHVLLLAQTTPGLNGPWIYQGANTEMIRPDDFGGMAQPTTAHTVTVGPDGSTHAHSRWRTTWADSAAVVDTDDPKFVREDGTVNVKLFGAIGDGPGHGGAGYNVSDLFPIGIIHGNSGPSMGTDNTVALQAAIDYCINDSINNSIKNSPHVGPRRIFIPAGTYRITSPLRLWRVDPDSGKFVHFSLQIVGETRNIGSPDSVIFADFIDGPALMIQAGYGVVLRDIAIVGQNRVDIAFANRIVHHTNLDPTEGQMKAFSDMFSSDANFLYVWMANWQQSPVPPGMPMAQVRDNIQSPYAGICIDPFGPVFSESNQYTGFSEEYQRLGDYSSGLVIQGVQVEKFTVGIMFSPSGKNANAENITVRDVSVASCKVGFGIAQSQTRNVNFENCTVHESLFALDTVSYGSGTSGTLPNIRGLSVDQTKYIFNVTAESSSAVIDQLYCEATASIGFIAGGGNVNNMAITFTGCQFDLERTAPMIDTHMSNFVGVAFVGCSFVVSGDVGDPAAPQKYAPISFYNNAPISFVNCALNAGLPGPPAKNDPNALTWANNAPSIGFQQPELVTFDGLRLIQNVGGGPSGSSDASFMRRDYTSAVRSLIRQHMVPGARVTPSGTDVTLQKVDGVFRLVTSHLREVDIGSVTLKVFDLESIIFPEHMGGRLLPGDVVYCPHARLRNPTLGHFIPYYRKPHMGDQAPVLDPPGFYASDGPIGIVSKVDAAGTVIRHVPRNFFKLVQKAPGISLPLVVKRFGRYHPATRGVVQPGSPVITGVSVDGATLSESWKPYDRITDELGLFPSGTFVTVVEEPVHKIVVSRPALQSEAPSSPIRLFDADVLRFSGTPE